MDDTKSNQEQPTEPAPTAAKPGLDNLPAFPSDGEPEILIRKRDYPVVEICAGALLGLPIGLIIGGFCISRGTGVIACVIGFALPVVVAGLIGWIVGHVTGPAGSFTVGTVLAAIPRVVLVALMGVFMTMIGVIYVPSRRRDDD